MLLPLPHLVDLSCLTVHTLAGMAGTGVHGLTAHLIGRYQVTHCTSASTRLVSMLSEAIHKIGRQS